MVFFFLLESLANVKLPIENSDDVNSEGSKGGSLVTNFATLAACRKVDDLRGEREFPFPVIPKNGGL